MVLEEFNMNILDLESFCRNCFIQNVTEDELVHPSLNQNLNELIFQLLKDKTNADTKLIPSRSLFLVLVLI